MEAAQPVKEGVVSLHSQNIKKVAIIGAGAMGSGIALIFASRGFDVGLMDTSREMLTKAVNLVQSNLSLLAGNGIGEKEDIGPAVNRIETVQEIKDAVKDAQFVIESVPENLELKQNVFAELDSICPPKTILATNTSVMSITEIAQKARLQERIIGTHFWNPPFLLPLVEVVKAQNTSDEVMEATVSFLIAVGKHPVRVQKDVPGFVANRLQHALWREAVSIVERGIADAATVDECIRFSFGLRLPVLGPMENIDMVGADLTLAIHDYILRHLESSPDPSPLLKQKVAEGELGFKTGRGFREWPAQEAEESRTRLIKHLMAVLKT